MAPIDAPPTVLMKPITEEAVPARWPSGSMASELKFEPIQPNWNMTSAKKVMKIGNGIGIAIAVVLLSVLTMITRRKAMSQVVGFLSMENGLFFGAMSATYGMPMIIELGVALDVLVAMLVLGVFFFQIREQFDSLDLHHLESLKEDK